MKILWFGHPDFHGDDFDIISLKIDPRSHLSGLVNPHRFPNLGRNGIQKNRMIGTSFGCDELFREHDRQYLDLCERVVAEANKYDVLVMSQFNFLHPYFLKKIRALKVLGMVDDPISTFDRSLSYSHFFDGCFHISQGYWAGQTMTELLLEFDLKEPYFLPLTNERIPTHLLEEDDFCNRGSDVVYIGAAYGKKVDVLRSFRNQIGNSINVYGRWPFHGYYGFLRAIWGKSIFPKHVKCVSEEEKWNIYRDTKIGLNLHYTGIGNEDGNIRTYEIVANGCLLLTNVSSSRNEDLLFKPDTEAIYYDSYSDAVDKIKYFLKNDSERIEIANNGHRKYLENYTHKKNLVRFVQWLRAKKRKKS